jgi:hypothetical protein
VDGRGPFGLGKEFREVYQTSGWPAVWQTYLEHAPASSWPVYKRWALVFLHREQEALDMLEQLEQRRLKAQPVA